MATNNTNLIKATYKQYLPTSDDPKVYDWYTVYFYTSAGLVGERAVTKDDEGNVTQSSLYFLRPETHTVNGKSFYGTTHQGITLYGSDIKVSDAANAITIADDLKAIWQNLDAMDDTYAESSHTHTWANITDAPTILNSTDITDIADFWGWLGDNYLITTQALCNSLSYYAPNEHTHILATTAADGFMSKDDKSRLDSMWKIWSADDTNDTLVNKIEEVLSVFNNYPEGDNLVTALSNKADKTHNHDGKYLKLVKRENSSTLYDASMTGKLTVGLCYIEGNEGDAYFGNHVEIGGELLVRDSTLFRGDANNFNYEVYMGGFGTYNSTTHHFASYAFAMDSDQNITITGSTINIKDSNGATGVVLDVDTAEYTINGKNISTTNIYYGAVDPTKDNNANNVQAGDIWLEYANGVG